MGQSRTQKYALLENTEHQFLTPKVEEGYILLLKTQALDQTEWYAPENIAFGYLHKTSPTTGVLELEGDASSFSIPGSVDDICRQHHFTQHIPVPAPYERRRQF